VTLSSSVRPADLTAIRIGDEAACETLIGAAEIDAFVALSGDSNPLHLDADVARQCGFPRQVAHGMLALSMISRLIGTELPGGGSLWVSQDLRFASPVLVGDTLRAQVVVEQVSLAARIVQLKTTVVNAHSGATVLSGTAKVRVPPRTSQALNA
jgi:acyl dehydratase